MNGIRKLLVAALGAAALVCLATGLLSLRTLRGPGVEDMKSGDILEQADRGLMLLGLGCVLGLGSLALFVSAPTRKHGREERPDRAEARRPRDPAREAIAGHEELFDFASMPPIAELRRDLDDPGPGVRLEAARVLRKLGRAAEEARPDLVRVLERDEEELSVRRAAIFALLSIDNDADPVLPTLLRLLEEPDPRARDWAVVTLGMMGPCAEPATPWILKLLRVPVHRATVKESLRRILGPERAERWIQRDRLEAEGA
jgi:hypothetical protein